MIGPRVAVAPLVLVLEGPSAVGKTTLARALAAECGAAVVLEHEGSEDTPPANAGASAWFIERSATQWRLALERGTAAPFAVLDGDPFKGLWYNWIFADEGWDAVDVVAPMYRAHIVRGTLAFPDLYILLGATEEALRQRRSSDPTRTRRNFEKHLRLGEPQRRYFAALAEAAPGRVAFLDSSERGTLVASVLDAMRELPPAAPDSARLLDHMADWVRGA